MERQKSSLSPLDNRHVIGGVAGIGFFILFAVAIVSQGDTAQYSDNVNDIRSFFADHANQYIVGDWLAGMAVVFFFFPFIMSLRAVLGRADRSGIWANLALLGGISWALISGATGAMNGALALDKAQSFDDASLKLAMAMSDYGSTTAIFGLALLTGASAVVIVRTSVIWRWLGILAGIAALLCVIAALGELGHGEGAFDFFNLLGSLLSALFVLLSGVCMVGRRNVADEVM